MQSKWPKVKLGEVLTKRKEKPDLNAILNGEIPIVAKIEFNTGRIEFREESNTKTNMILIRPGDLVLSGINAAKGAIAIYDENNTKPAAATIHYSSYIINKEKVDPLYLWYFMRSDIFRKILISNLPNGIKTEVKPRRLLSIEVPLPSLNEQKRIVSIIKKTIRKIKEAKQLRDEIIRETIKILDAFLYKLQNMVGNNFTPLINILKEKPRNGWSFKCDNGSNGVPILTLSAVTGFKYKPFEFKRTSLPVSKNAHYWLSPGDILITRSNTLELVGHVAIYNGEPFPCIYPDLMMKIKVNHTIADTTFVYYWLRTPLVRDYIKKNAKGTSAFMKKISQNVVMNIPFPKNISLLSQRRIVEFLNNLQFKLDCLKNHQQEIQTEINILTQSILSNAFKGEI